MFSKTEFERKWVDVIRTTENKPKEEFKKLEVKMEDENAKKKE